MRKLALCICLILLFGLQSLISTPDLQSQSLKGSTASVMDAESMLRRLEALYNTREYRKAYSEIESILSGTSTIKLNSRQQAEIYRYGVLLSFILDLYAELDEYLNEFYRFDSDFSVDDLPGASPILKLYVQKFLDSKVTNLVFVGKQKSSLDNLPASVSVFSADDIERLGVRNFMDLIRLVPGIMEVGDNNERMVGARGFSSGTTTNDMLFLINGHRINDHLTSSANPDFIAIESIQQVEILRGSGSTFYGPNAFSAVINVITKRGTDNNNSSMSVFFEENDLRNFDIGDASSMVLNAEFGEKISNTQSFYAFAQINQSAGALLTYDESNPAITPNQSRNTGKEYVNRNGPEYHFLLNYASGAFELTANSQLINFVPARNQQFELWQNFDQDTVRNFRSRKDRRTFIHSSYEFLKDREEDGYSLSMHVGLDYYGKYIPFNNFYNNISTGLLQGDEFRQSVRLEYSTEHFLTKRGSKSFTLFGIEALRNQWNFRYSIYDAATNSLQWIGNRAFEGDGVEDSEIYLGFYTQTERDLVKDKLKLSFGVRVNYHNVYADFSRFKWGEEYNPRLNLVWNSTDWIKAKLIYSSSFLAPPFLYRTGLPDGSGYNSVNELRSQSVSNGQLMLFGRLIGGFSYDIQYFHNQINNLIQRTSIGYANLDEELVIRGFEGEIKYKGTLQKGIDVQAFANYSVTEAHKYKDDKEYTYLQGFNLSNLNVLGENHLAFFPDDMIKIGLNVKTSLGNSNSIINSNQNLLELSDNTIATDLKGANVLVGITMERYGSYPVRRFYDDQDGDGLWDIITNDDGSLSTTPLVSEFEGYWLIHAFAELQLGKLSMRLGSYNLQNTRALLPAQYYVNQMGIVSAEPMRMYTTIKYRF